MSLIYKKLNYINPQDIFEVAADRFGTIFLDSNMFHEHYGRYSYIVINPVHIYSATTQSNITDEILGWQELFADNLQSNNDSLPPFTGGLVGFLSYDLGKQFEFITTNNSRSVPDYCFGLYNQIFAFDLFTKSCYLIVAPINGFGLDYDSQLNNMLTIYNKALDKNLFHQRSINQITLPSIQLKSNFTKNNYIKKVNKAIQYIYDGDIFEINLAQCFSSKVPVNYPCSALYHKLRHINPAPFSAYLNFGELMIMSASPERFISINNGKVEARPIKGTAKRGLNDEEDLNLANRLKNSEKDIAENIMIVDLMRNDLSQICTPASVSVSQLCEVESFTNIHHLVSVINGKLSNNASIFDIIPKCFPGGSITGAPKIRAMQIIDELEQTNRGVYCGSIGYFGFNGNVDLSIAIRTIIKHGTDLRFYVGGAITLDSNAEDEYNETLLKGQKLSEIFT